MSKSMNKSMSMNDMVLISVDDHITEPPDMFDPR